MLDISHSNNSLVPSPNVFKFIANSKCLEGSLLRQHMERLKHSLNIITITILKKYNYLNKTRFHFPVK